MYKKLGSPNDFLKKSPGSLTLFLQFLKIYGSQP